MNDRPQALYRFYADDGTLLYVGITLDPGKRWKQHRDDKPWWGEVSQITVEQYATRDLVLAAERAAIIAERPRYNVTYNGKPQPQPTPRHRHVATTAPNPDVQVIKVTWASDRCITAQIHCPHCGRRHTHGLGDNPRRLSGGHRVAHCSAGRGLGYTLITADAVIA